MEMMLLPSEAVSEEGMVAGELHWNEYNEKNKK